MDIEDAGPGPDPDMDMTLPRVCDADAECDDGVLCTRDLCDGRGQCVFSVDHAVCDDGVFCNGLEQCVTGAGCTAGVSQSCNDVNVCTLDRCVEADKTCEHTPRDFDGDGEADWHCAGGTDCDDLDPARGALQTEICNDGQDNDCDEVTDEVDCGRPIYDVCSDALSVDANANASNVFTLNMLGTRDDVGASCDGPGREVVLTWTSTETYDVRVRAEGDGDTQVAVRQGAASSADCGGMSGELGCRSGTPGELRLRALPAGTYYAMIASLASEVSVSVDFDAPTVMPTHQSCSTATNIEGMGPQQVDFVGATDAAMVACGTSNAGDLFYTVNIDAADAPRDLVVSAVSTTGETMFAEVRADCLDAASALRCVRGSPASGRFYALPAGQYTVVIEGPDAHEVDAVVEMRLEPPSAPPAGDRCDNPLPLTLDADTDVLGTLANMQDNIALSCGYGYRDAVYEFTLTERQDVTVEVDSATRVMNMAIHETCGDALSQLRCTSGNPAKVHLRDLAAGTYFLTVESVSPVAYRVHTETAPPTMPVAATANDTCDTAWPMMASVGTQVFVGNTSTLQNDYETAQCGGMARSPEALFRLELTESSMVHVLAEGDFDTVLLMWRDSCTDTAQTCNDDGGDGSAGLIEQELSEGTYFFAVDGFGAASAGAYALELTIDP